MNLFKSWVSCPDKTNQFTLEDMQRALKTPEKYIIINTLTYEYHDCLIPGTVPDTKEESVINEMLNNFDQPDKPIIIYGKNSHDETPHTKWKQLRILGLSDIFIYGGGLFEWLLLHEVYGPSEFPIISTSKMPDIWKYR
jgi:hypothetical protein